MLFFFIVEYAFRRINQEGLKFNGTHQHVIYADDFNILGGSIRTIETDTEALVVTSKENDIEVNAEKTKYMVVLHKRYKGNMI